MAFVATAAAKKIGGKAAKRRQRPPGSGSTPRTKPEHIPTTDEVNAGVTSADLEARSAAPAPTSSGTGAAASSDVRPASAGGGLVLGVLLYALGRTYLEHGRDGVKRLLKAKFLNEVS